VLESLRSRYKHILVDEFQDTNAAQYALLQALAFGPSALSAFPSSAPSSSGFDEMSEKQVQEVKRPTLVSAAALGPSVFVAGDDDQSIYSFQVPTTSLHKAFSHDLTPVSIFPRSLIVSHPFSLLTDVCLFQRVRGRARRSVPFWKTSLGRWRSAYERPTACRATYSSPPRRYVPSFLTENGMGMGIGMDGRGLSVGEGVLNFFAVQRHEDDDEIVLKMMRPATDVHVCASGVGVWRGQVIERNEPDRFAKMEEEPREPKGVRLVRRINSFMCQ
jgi:hypothetical protein